MRSSTTLVQASGDSTGGRAEIEQIVDVPAQQILEQSVEVIKVIPEEWMLKRIVQQIADVPEVILGVVVRLQSRERQHGWTCPQPQEQNVEVVQVILQEQCQRMRVFSFDSVWEGSCGRHVPHVLRVAPHPREG